MKNLYKVLFTVNIIIYVWSFVTPSLILSQSLTYYVSKQGSDSNDGSMERPFATIQKGIDTVKRLKIANAKILIRKGMYEINSSILIREIENGLILSSFPEEKVIIVGGRRIKGFKPVNKEIKLFDKIKKEVREKIYYIDLKKLGINKYGKIMPRGFKFPITPSGAILYFNDNPMNIARWPDDGWVKTGKIPKKLEKTGFKYIGRRPEHWHNTGDIWMYGFWYWDWADAYLKIEKIDTLNKEIIVSNPQSPYFYNENRRYYVFNLIEELDFPGEWYLDRKTGILYFYPPDNLKNSEIFISLLKEPVLKIEDSRGIKVRNIIFSYSNGAGIIINGGSNNKIEKCTLKNLGTVGISIGDINANTKIYKNPLYNGNAGINNGVSNCTIYNCGEGGIVLGGGDRKKLIHGNNFVLNTLIYKTSERVKTYRGGIYMYGVGNIISHNEIYDLPHTAIFFWGNNHIIEFNNIHNVCKETVDAGALYIGRDWTQRGHIIRYNYIHNLRKIKAKGNFTDIMGIYLDDFSSGIKVYGNIFYRAGRNILIGGGRDNTIKNNIFIEGEPAIHIDARGIDWASFYFKNKEESILLKRFKLVNADTPPYSEQYPELKKLLKDKPYLPKNNCISNNVFCGGKRIEFIDKASVEMVCLKNNLVLEKCDFYKITGNNIFINYKKIHTDKNFKEIPSNKIGIISNFLDECF